jgi:peptidyl-prolyl cis-trans isomerase D
MLSNFRAFAKSPAAAVLIGLLVVAFAVFGIRDVFRGRVAGDNVITAGTRSVSPADFKREFDSAKSRIEQQMQQEIPVESAVANGLDRRVLEGLAGREAFAEVVRKMGVQPSDKLIAEEINKMPAFFDQVTGKFDRKSYQQRLAENGLTPPKFDQILRDAIAQQQVGTGLLAGMRVPRAYTALAAIFGLESRDIGFFPIEPSSVPQPAAPTDAQLTAFMKENSARLTRPEARVLTVVRFSPQLVGAGIAIDEAELKKRFDFRKDTLSTPETRTIIQIPAKDPPTAQQIGQRLAKGEAPAAVAKAVGVEAITYENKPRTAIADRKIAEAAFRMLPGQVAPAPGDLGLAVIKVVSVTPGRAVTLEEVRPALEAEIRKDAAAEKVYALTQAYDDAHQGGSSLADSAQKAGVPAVTIGPLTKTGRDLQGQPVPGLTQKLVEAAFTLPAGGESEVEDAGGGEYFAVRVEKIVPPSMPPLAEIRPQLTQVWTMREIAKRMQARAETLAERVRKGESLDAVAASAAASVTHVPGVSRRNAAQTPGVSQDILGKAFGAKPGEVFTAENSHFGFVVGKLEAVHAGEGPTLARMTEDMRPQMSVALARELAETAQFAARRKVKVVIDANRARTALGLEPLDAGKGPAAKPGAKAEKAK